MAQLRLSIGASRVECSCVGDIDPALAQHDARFRGTCTCGEAGQCCFLTEDTTVNVKPSEPSCGLFWALDYHTLVLVWGPVT